MPLHTVRTIKLSIPTVDAKQPFRASSTATRATVSARNRPPLSEMRRVSSGCSPDQFIRRKDALCKRDFSERRRRRRRMLTLLFCSSSNPGVSVSGGIETQTLTLNGFNCTSLPVTKGETKDGKEG